MTGQDPAQPDDRRLETHREQLQKLGVEPFDLVV